MCYVLQLLEYVFSCGVGRPRGRTPLPRASKAHGYRTRAPYTSIRCETARIWAQRCPHAAHTHTRTSARRLSLLLPGSRFATGSAFHPGGRRRVSPRALGTARVPTSLLIIPRPLAARARYPARPALPCPLCQRLLSQRLLWQRRLLRCASLCFASLLPLLLLPLLLASSCTRPPPLLLRPSCRSSSPRAAARKCRTERTAVAYPFCNGLY